MIIYLIGVALAVLVLEHIIPGWKLPKVSTWFFRSMTLNIIQIAVALLAGVSWNKWMQGHSLFHLSASYSPLVAGFIAYFVNTFVTYWWHRFRHANNTLWRLFHQIHHAPQRIEVFTSFYKHPTEMVFNSMLGSAVAYVLLGISVEAGAFYVMFAALGEMFYHANIRTPHFLGYLFQRPEMHRVHHQRDRHECNYSDFPIWDMLFGTFENPKENFAPQGFSENKENRFVDMLLFKDVHETPAGMKMPEIMKEESLVKRG
ncbi:desaturase [Pseudomonas sp. A25(2017)]|uniref:Sterol desaturase/sphingolipid hydroxylase, fatty acid hydroxylase superfamily n=1 Tax=Pseudomonas kilonensis TaxID=132476 RepID=A0ABY0YQD7_9PSED|nr:MULTISPECIES: sterol desaturase family protein [Pseudomonas]OOG89073.1 desaturase [Pseudomonas sp. A25(2017)]SED84859.1 Sterol desaturase/sphingolipid hydroxylase, fatty acid hydroxylase superfamily [Pseudomonas kilonensis]